MNLNDYQDIAQSTAVYPNARGLEYVALGLAGEAGEFANKVKKVIRDGTYDQAALADELGDVLWYLAMAAYEIDVSLSWIAQRNVTKLAERKRAGTLKGSGDNR